jgi:hypothetical protein
MVICCCPHRKIISKPCGFNKGENLNSKPYNRPPAVLFNSSRDTAVHLAAPESRDYPSHSRSEALAWCGTMHLKWLHSGCWDRSMAHSKQLRLFSDFRLAWATQQDSDSKKWSSAEQVAGRMITTVSTLPVINYSREKTRAADWTGISHLCSHELLYFIKSKPYVTQSVRYPRPQQYHVNTVSLQTHALYVALIPTQDHSTARHFPHSQLQDWP